MSSFRESDLYAPVRDFLEGQGYSVKAEVGYCDVTAVRGGTLLAVELKPTASLRLIMQAVSRLETADSVYIAVPADAPAARRERSSLIRLLRLLGLGLLLVDTESGSVSAVLDPSEYRPRKRKARRELLLRQHAELAGDPNTGGSRRLGGIMTPYRQRALRIAALLRNRGPVKASEVRDELVEPAAWGILYRNVYGWFERVGKGSYALSPRGEREVAEWTLRGGRAGVSDDGGGGEGG
ncbi:hypothetical protein GX411_06355 [Candidatus Fermentibacteria bacterium]|nr:hypothetical protein [Candidatus Fermentibacteria bacterium]